MAGGADFSKTEHYTRWYDSPWGRYADRAEKALFLRMVRPVTGETLLDVGCGTGRWLNWCDGLGLNAIGIDISTEMIQARGGACAQSGRYPYIVRADAHEIPFGDNQFDIVTAITTLEFVQTPVRALQEMARVCRRRIAIGSIGGRSLYARQMRRRGEDSVISRARLYSVGQLLQLIREAIPGCTCEWRTTLLGPMHNGPWAIEWLRALDRLPGADRLPWGGYIGVVISQL